MRLTRQTTPLKCPRDQAGVTLMELMVVVGLTSVLGFVALPNFSRFSGAFNRMNTRNYLLIDLKRAQSESITQGCRGIVKINSDLKGYTFGCDYLSYDASENPSPDKISFRRNLPSQITLNSNAPVIFNSRGETVDIDGIMSNSTITLTERVVGENIDFAVGTLLGTGVFTYQ